MIYHSDERKSYYSGFSKRFIGLGFMVSYRDTPFTEHERLLIEIKAGFYKFWLIYYLKERE